jgi:rhodanese-related sulfurtransferase
MIVAPLQTPVRPAIPAHFRGGVQNAAPPGVQFLHHHHWARRMIPQLTPTETWQALSGDPDAVLLDVRSKVEYDFVGHPAGALHVPWQEAPHWQVDTDFVRKVRERLSALRPGCAPEDLHVYCLCRSGARSQAAAQALAAAGFRHAANVSEGFEGERDQDRHRNTVSGWRFRGLPWEQT